MKLRLPTPNQKKSLKPKDKHIYIIIFILILLGASIFFSQNRIASLNKLVTNLTSQKDSNYQDLEKIKKEIEDVKAEDQYKKNKTLQEEIQNIEKTYEKAVKVYEELLDLKSKSKETKALDDLFAKSLSQLAKRDFGAAEATLNQLSTKISEEDEKVTASVTIPQNVPESNAPPGSGYSRQQVQTDAGVFMVSIVAGDLGSTKVIVDTASDSDCTNDCPVLPLATYVARNGAFAGVNGSYFCPAEYPTCAGKTNSYDLLVMNYKKTYFNSGNNVYSNNPAVIFGDSYVRFVSSASQWGRDTSPNGVLSNYPLLVHGGNITFGGDDDPKKGSKGSRSFVANKGNTVYIGVVHNATVAESARVMKALAMENALNLDNGGSTALWSGGYKVGPGRNLPNVILFLRK
ncbi:hypothetical protein A2685_00285 [Candidatus Woesebacteria bacterium RIFCSPHIGHO2_01_FULL_37_10]|uniref:Phosphodiester glycosidase domain-containing protein n=1 Tax=Candidatus Woesebacteria bacterium RIFCSPHIGHO2_01_FULL_37_10 TaxID=1802489 RepID=A0A1F7XYN3_9BACT|nr:MAG: hypothetical protein A2685_00285 [Candidatus Woesebacteria bacterium RIFCSPHIGHO2_01_FULL_37_10]